MKRLACLALFLLSSPAWGQSSFVNSKEHDGESLTVDLPGRLHIRNIGSFRDGAGMCVMSSIEMSALAMGMDHYKGLRDWCAKEPGGAYPSKVDRQLAAFCKEKGLPPPKYVQYEGPNPEKILDLIDKTGRMACITYGRSPRYRGQIAHMTCCPKFSGQYAVCLDNNFPGEDKYEWMSKDELVKRVKYPGNSGWVFVWTANGPPLPPFNKKDK